MARSSQQDQEESPQPGTRSQLIYVLPEDALPGRQNDELTLLEAWSVLWGHKWLIAGITTVSAVLAIAYALTATPWYRASVLLAPVKANSAPSLTGTLGSLANMAGLSVGAGDNTKEAIAILQSRDFTRAFIRDYHLLPVLFPKAWNKSTHSWRAAEVADHPDDRDGVRYFARNVRKVSQDNDTGLVTLTIEWKDPTVAASWANLLVKRLNQRMRQRALAEAQTNVAFLKKEFSATSVVTLQQSIGQLLETELQKLMLARGRKEFAFRVIDSARPPKVRTRPARTLIVVMSTVVGGLLAVCIAFVHNAVKNARSDL